MKKLITTLLVFGYLLGSCGGGDDGPGADPIVPILPPEASVLVFPYQNSECEEGTNLSNTESTVKFEWKNAANADSYTLYITNLLSNTSTNYDIEVNFKEVRLLRAVPYAWKVVSKSEKIADTAESTSWRFYNQGLGDANTIPFPADVLAPLSGASITTAAVDLYWSGLDIDDDIQGYDVYFGVTNPPTNLIAENTSEENVKDVSVNTGKYYWYVITKDNVGNTSTSQLFYFEVK